MKKTKRFKLLFVAQDVGGFNSLLPVIKKNKRGERFEATVFLAGASREFARREKLDFVDLDGATAVDVDEAVFDLNPRLLVTGTSGGNSIDKLAILSAKKLNIPTVSILDFWINYNIRFNLENKSEIDEKLLPDYILVMDEIARKEMIECGFPKAKLVITGNSHFDRLKKQPRFPRGKNNSILFVDQPIEESIRKGWHIDYGYTEKEVFRDLIEALSEINFKGDVLIKFHPSSSDFKKYDFVKAKPGINIRVINEVDHDKALTQCGMVVGMTSILLFESALSGKKVISYQPRMSERDPLISNRLDISHFVFKKTELAKTTKKLLKQKSPTPRVKKVIDRYVNNNSTEKVINFINGLVK